MSTHLCLSMFVSSLKMTPSIALGHNSLGAFFPSPWRLVWQWRSDLVSCDDVTCFTFFFSLIPLSLPTSAEWKRFYLLLCWPVITQPWNLNAVRTCIYVPSFFPPWLCRRDCTHSADGLEVSPALRLGLWPAEEEKMVLMKWHNLCQCDPGALSIKFSTLLSSVGGSPQQVKAEDSSWYRNPSKVGADPTFLYWIHGRNIYFFNFYIKPSVYSDVEDSSQSSVHIFNLLGTNLDSDLIKGDPASNGSPPWCPLLIEAFSIC